MVARAVATSEARRCFREGPAAIDGRVVVVGRGNAAIDVAVAVGGAGVGVAVLAADEEEARLDEEEAAIPLSSRSDVRGRLFPLLVSCCVLR